MNEWVLQSSFLGVVLSLLAYEIGRKLNRTFRIALFNPLLIAVILVGLVLIVFRIPYDRYLQSAKWISWLLTPATVCLAVPMYEKMLVLRKHAWAITAGIVSGILGSLVAIWALALLFRLDHSLFATLLPKSITTAIGMGLSEELGGQVTLTVACIIVTGVFGNMVGEQMCRLLRLNHPVAKGLSLGVSAHAIGTVRAMEMGEIEGAISSLSLVLTGLGTVVLAPVFATLI